MQCFKYNIEYNIIETCQHAIVKLIYSTWENRDYIIRRYNTFGFL